MLGFLFLLQEKQQWRAQKEEESLKNSVLDTATAALFSTAAALEARGRTGDRCALFSFFLFGIPG